MMARLTRDGKDICFPRGVIYGGEYTNSEPGVELT